MNAWRSGAARRAARLGVERVLERLVADAAEEKHSGVRLLRARAGGAPREALSLFGEQLDAQHLRVAHCARAREHLLERVHREAHRRERDQLALLLTARVRAQRMPRRRRVHFLHQCTQQMPYQVIQANDNKPEVNES